MVENAVRHAPRTGHIEIEVRQPATITVSDDGPGIPPSERKLVFQRFWRRKSDAVGSAGLGLAIVAKIIELHGGDVEVSESSTGGAKITLTLTPHPDRSISTEL